MRTDIFPITGVFDTGESLPLTVQLVLEPGDNVLEMTPDEARLIASRLSGCADGAERRTALITAIGRDEFARRAKAGEDPFGEFAGKPIEEWKL